MVEGARLESVYTPKGYPGFESLSLRISKKNPPSAGFFLKVVSRRVRRGAENAEFCWIKNVQTERSLSGVIKLINYQINKLPNVFPQSSQRCRGRRGS